MVWTSTRISKNGSAGYFSVKLLNKQGKEIEWKKNNTTFSSKNGSIKVVPSLKLLTNEFKINKKLIICKLWVN